MKPTAKVLCALAAVWLAGQAVPALAAQAANETPPVLKAAQFVPAQLLKGPGYSVEARVANDGYLNTYRLHSKFGDLRVVSTELLLTRIHEVRAMEKMAALESSEEFGKAVARGGENIVKGATNLVKAPVGSLNSAASGVGRLFRRAEESLRSEKSKHEDSTTNTLLGVARTKREYAVQFGVDPYSTNPLLQKRLTEIAQAGAAGGLTSTVVKAMIPGGIGFAVSASSSTNWLKEVDLSLPPSELRMQGREKLLAMGLSPALAEAFINEVEFSPSQQAMIVAALTAMAGVQGKEVFVRLLLTTGDADVALDSLVAARGGRQAGHRLPPGLPGLDQDQPAHHPVLQ